MSLAERVLRNVPTLKPDLDNTSVGNSLGENPHLFRTEKAAVRQLFVVQERVYPDCIKEKGD